MIYIVHGENTAKSRAQINNQQKKIEATNVNEVNLEDISIQELTSLVNSNSLFGDKTFVVLNVTNIKATEEHINVLKNKSPNTIVIIYAEKNIPKTSVFIKNSQELQAKIVENIKEHNENIFKFIDTLFYKNRTETYKEYEKLIKAETDDFYLFTMMMYGLRSIAKGFYKSPSFEKGAPFTKSKVTAQLKGFSEDTVKKLYEDFYTLEKKAKTGEIQPENAVFLGIENVLNSK